MARKRRGERRRQILELVAIAGHDGVTNQELAQLMDSTASTISGATSQLHSNGQISRLADHRDGRAVYVLPSYVNGRRLYRSAHERAIGQKGELTDKVRPVTADEARQALADAVSHRETKRDYSAEYESMQKVWREGFAAGWAAAMSQDGAP